jgi:hypothetical protein
MGNGALSSEVKRQGREADNSPPSNAEVNNGGAIPLLLPTCLHAIVLNYLSTETTLRFLFRDCNVSYFNNIEDQTNTKYTAAQLEMSTCLPCKRNGYFGNMILGGVACRNWP